MGLISGDGKSKLSDRIPKMMRLLCIGDSITDDYWKGVGVFDYYPVPNPANHWTHILATELEVDMVNKGIAGDSAINIATNRIQTDMLNWSPTHVTIECGGNDIYAGTETLEQIVDHIKTIVKACTDHNIMPILMWFPISVNPKGTAPISKQQDYLTRMSGLLKAYADSVNVLFVDFQKTALGTGYTVNMDYYIPDGIHPNTAGHNLIAKYLLDIFDQKILPKVVDPVDPTTNLTTIDLNVDKDWEGGIQYDYETVHPKGAITGIGVKGNASLISLTPKKNKDVDGSTYNGNMIEVAYTTNSITVNAITPLSSIDYTANKVFNGEATVISIDMPTHFDSDNMTV